MNLNFLTNLSPFRPLCVIVTVLSVFSFNVDQAKAGTSETIRNLTNTNLYTCSTGRFFEWEWMSGNIYGVASTLRLGCLNTDGTARWLLRSKSICEGEDCRSIAMPKISRSYDPDSDRHIVTYILSGVAVGVDCRRKLTSSEQATWECENVRSYQNFTLKTIGQEEGVYGPIFAERFGSYPPISGPITPRNSQQRSALQSALQCAGLNCTQIPLD